MRECATWAWTDPMRRACRDSRCNSALARRRASKLARRCAPPCDSPSTPPRYVSSRARARARILVLVTRAFRGRRSDQIRSIDRRDRPSRSIDRSCDPIDLIRSPREFLEFCAAVWGFVGWMFGHVASLWVSDRPIFYCIVSTGALRASMTSTRGLTMYVLCVCVFVTRAVCGHP